MLSYPQINPTFPLLLNRRYYKVSIIKSKLNLIMYLNISHLSLCILICSKKNPGLARDITFKFFLKDGVLGLISKIWKHPNFERRNLNPYMAVTICDQLFLNPSLQLSLNFQNLQTMSENPQTLSLKPGTKDTFGVLTLIRPFLKFETTVLISCQKQADIFSYILLVNTLICK
ncbi:Hypothetical_protein [Hexamita inflata]|uniref:Hypothetical_protein n=1 Tax=Hexamita inflata TaxID=28002 RepID=A0AA86TM64_9EUKA|nr:Hypothetical protein HINF_LOCUS7502 [Hexamita inflata]